MRKECLVTGGAGFIGSNVVQRLVRDGQKVRILDNLSTGRPCNLESVRKHIELIDGDIRDARAVKKAVRGISCVFHMAALPSVIRSVKDPAASNDVNVNGTLQLLLAARDAGVERFVFSSSSSVYGESKTLPKHEEMTPGPLSPYAVQKLTGEHYCRVFHGLYGLKTYALRYFNVFGPRQDPASHYAAVIPLFIKAFLAGKRPIIFGDGRQTRDFTFVEDVVDANVRCSVAPSSAAGQVFNVAGGNRSSLLDLARILSELTGRDIKPVHKPARPGDIRHSQGAYAKARKALGWKARVSFREGLEKTVDYFRSQEG